MRWLHLPGSNPDEKATLRRRHLGFAMLFTLSIGSRALLLTATPLRAFQILGSEELVGLAYVVGSLGSLLLTLTLPALYSRLPRSSVYLLGALLAMLAPLLISSDQVALLLLGLACQLAAVALLEITLNLYVLDHVERKHLSRFEPMRLALSATAWTAGPWLGIKLATVVPNLPFYVSSAIAVLLAGAFLLMRPTVKGKAVKASAVANVGLFLKQPRLRLAWVLAFSRSTWWVLFFVYGQIYFVEGLGYDEETASLLSSMVMAATFLIPLWGWIGRRIGMRRLLWIGYGLSGASTLLLAAVGSPAWVAAALLVACGILTSVIDGAGNVPYLRAVKPSQRSRMTAVFMTYRDASQLIPPAIFSGLLALFPFASLFVVTGLLMGGMTLLIRHIPRRM